MPFSDYRWAAGHNIALVSLHSVENDLRPHNYREAGWARHSIGISSPVLEQYPVRFVKGSGREGGGGTINHEWLMTITTYALDYILDTYLPSGIDAAMTIYTRLHMQNTYGRYNAYLVYPSRSQGDIEYLRGNIVRFRPRWHKLTAL
jgi:hypothetical protein